MIGSKDTDIKLEIDEETGKGKKLYMIYDKFDAEKVRPLIRYINKKGIEVLEPSFEGDLMDWSSTNFAGTNSTLPAVNIATSRSRDLSWFLKTW